MFLNRSLVRVSAVLLMLGLFCTGCASVGRQNTDCTVVIETSMGTMKAELWRDKAPNTVDNFLAYVDAKYYDGLVFHRVMKNFMIQGGAYDLRLMPRKLRPPVKNEARSDVRNMRGTLAMARPMDIHGATSQFFISHVDNPDLDHKDNTDRGYGYCVFGKLTEGYDVLDAIAAVKTGTVGPLKHIPMRFQNIPLKPVVIKSIRRLAKNDKP